MRRPTRFDDTDVLLPSRTTVRASMFSFDQVLGRAYTLNGSCDISSFNCSSTLAGHGVRKADDDAGDRHGSKRYGPE